MMKDMFGINYFALSGLIGSTGLHPDTGLRSDTVLHPVLIN